LQDHFSNRAAVCREVPFCPWVSCGGRRQDPDLWDFCGARTRRSAR
jgi:hypothetical protein